MIGRRHCGNCSHRVGLTESLYEQERYEEILKVAAQIVALLLEIAPEAVADEWMRMVGQGVAGYVTPKAAVGAIVSNEEKEILLVQRADSGVGCIQLVGPTLDIHQLK